MRVCVTATQKMLIEICTHGPCTMPFSFTFRLLTAIRQSVWLVFPFLLNSFFSSSSSFAEFFTFRFVCIFLFSFSSFTCSFHNVFGFPPLLFIMFDNVDYNLFPVFLLFGQLLFNAACFLPHNFFCAVFISTFWSLDEGELPQKWQKYIAFVSMVCISTIEYDSASSIFHSFVFGHPSFSPHIPVSISPIHPIPLVFCSFLSCV